MRETEKRSELQERVAAELKEKLRSHGEMKTLNDSEPTFLENQHETDVRGIGVTIFIIVAVLVTAVFAYVSMKK